MFHATGYVTNAGEVQSRNRGNEYIKIYQDCKKSIPVMMGQHIQCESSHGNTEYMMCE